MDSITGAVLAATSPVFMPDSFNGFTNFFFAPAVALSPGTTYYFQPIVQSGDGCGTRAYNDYNYPGGMEFTSGMPFPNNDLWFREGVVPEPSSVALLALGIGALFVRRLEQARNSERFRKSVDPKDIDPYPLPQFVFDLARFVRDGATVGGERLVTQAPSMREARDTIHIPNLDHPTGGETAAARLAIRAI
jgi:hypothetical protein